MKDTGFTLGEVLVVTLIITVLASIAIPSFINYRHQAYDATLKSDMHSYVTAVGVWQAEHGELPPDASVFTDYTAKSPGTFYAMYYRDGDQPGVAKAQDGYVIYGYHESGRTLAYSTFEEKYHNNFGGRGKVLDPLGSPDRELVNTAVGNWKSFDW